MKQILLTTTIFLLATISFSSSQTQGKMYGAPVEIKQSRHKSNLVGIVFDADTKQPLNGVAISKKKGRKYKATDYNGEYKARIRPGNTLVFTYPGYKPTEYTRQKRINVQAVYLEKE